jgi:hypothetical protein
MTDDGDRGYDDGYDGVRPREKDAANPFYAAGYQEGYTEAKELCDGFVPRWAAENWQIVRKAQGWVKPIVRQEESADDTEWRREQAMEAGMAFGCNAFNEIMGWD